ncbi:type III secretion inner membrane ring lipoprotein SctJ [soil metagenome]
MTRSPSKPERSVRLRSALCIVAVLALLAGCDTQLLANLSERDSNEVLAVLLRAGVQASKESPDAGKTWTIQVPQDNVVQSLELLSANGLPRVRYANLGEMFKKDGLVSTPVEERVRFVYGVSQELSETLQRMDGVVAARVHIVMPQSDPMANAPKPASASVFIKHRAGMSPGTYTAAVKNLVAHSVEGLSYDAVSVVFVEAEPPPLPPPPPPPIWRLALLWAIAVAALAGAGAWLGWRNSAGLRNSRLGRWLMAARQPVAAAEGGP